MFAGITWLVSLSSGQSSWLAHRLDHIAEDLACRSNGLVLSLGMYHVCNRCQEAWWSGNSHVMMAISCEKTLCIYASTPYVLLYTTTRSATVRFFCYLTH